MSTFEIEQAVAARFDAVAHAFPNHLAVQAPAGAWSYAELARRSRSITRALQDRLPPGPDRVALLASHDAPAIAAILGILRAGKLWVPLDVRHPPGRLAEICADASPRLVVCDASHRATAGAIAGDHVLCLGDSGDDDQVADAAVAPGDIAYLLYTSGSTGQPKGVIQSHRNVLHHTRAYAHSLALAPDDRVALLASLAVDAAVMDVFGALLTGASLHLWDTAGRGTEGFADWLDAARITIYHSTPTVFRFWLEGLAADRRLASVRRVVLGGEPAYRDDLERFRRAFAADAVLVNGLGPTESTLALQGMFTTASEPADRWLPVGHPVVDTRVTLIDDDGRDAAGEGELVICSPYVALGYWNRPELTRAAFSDGPPGSAERRFRTGDIARRGPDGGLVVLGRRDLARKVRGIGVEPEEIEARLRACAGVREAAVILYERADAPAMLVAFASAADAVTLDPTAILGRLRDVLPPVMVPSRLEIVDSLPRTASAKIDRRALERRSAATSPVSASPPVGATQRWVARAFASLLKLDGLGGDSDFLALGGHSLLAVRLLARVRQELGVELLLEDLFAAPSVAGLAARIDAAAGAATRPAIERIDRDGPLPLSPAQERLLFFDQLVPGNPTYHVPAVSRLRGALDADALRHALGEVVARHDVLRATLHLEDGVPVQRISDAHELGLAFEQVSIEDTLPGCRLEQALALARTRAMLPFDLARGPLLRATLIRLAAADHVLALVVHHVAVDGWSMQQLFSEWSLGYAARLQGAPLGPATPALQYADFAAWHRRRLGEASGDALRAWWRQRLADVEELPLPTDRPRPGVQSHRGAWCTFALPADLVTALRALARDTGATMYGLYLCAFAAFLARHTGQDAVLVTSPIAYRPLAELQDMLGTFVNTIPLRVDLAGNPTLRALVERVWRTTLDAFAHAELPFDQIVAETRTARDPGRAPLTQAMLIYHQGAPGQLQVAGIAAEPIEIHLGVAMSDLSLTLRDGERVEGWFEYATDLFDAPTIERLRDRWLALLRAMVAAGAEARIDDLDVLPAAERKRLLVELNATTRPYDLETTIRARIAAQVAAHPDLPAVAFGHADAIRYADLLAWSRRIARALVAHGVTPGTLIPVVVGRGLDLAAALLGVLEAGAAFVPVDPGWPSERLRASLARMSPAAVVADAAHEAQAALGGLRVVSTAATRYGPVIASPVAPLARPEDPVYGYFTSGSTGEPKLPLVRHAGLSNRFAWMDEFFGPAPPVTLQTTQHFFDSAVWQLLWPLCRGGLAVIPGPELVLTAEAITALTEQHAITLIDFVPSSLDALLPRFAADPSLGHRLRSLRDVIAGGEALRPETLHAVHAAMPHVRLINLYGPTEATIGCVAAVLQGTETTIPIGRPIANVRAVVLDRAARLAPLGVPGELYLTGACLGLGYFGDPAATRRAFVDNPFPELGDRVLYRTGDRVQQRPDGTLDFLGRCDDQIKVRGLRIEPGEIEAALRSHPGVREAFVAAGRGAGGHAEVWAWIAPGPVPDDLRDHLRARLPQALVPAELVACAALPRGTGGKVDRTALPRPAEMGRPRPVEPPRTALEEIVAGVWAHRLGLAAVDRHANFFDLGGHSLLALTVHAELERAVGRGVPLVALFRYPTVQQLAGYLAGTKVEVEAPPTGELRAAAAARRRQRQGSP